jgi:hypothetical protein
LGPPAPTVVACYHGNKQCYGTFTIDVKSVSNEI